MKKLCSCTTVLLLLLSNIAVRAAPLEKVSFQQKVLFTNTTDEDIKPKMDSYKYSIKEVEEADLKQLDETAPIYAGDLANAILVNDELSFDSVIVPADSTDFEFVSDIEIEFKDFEKAGDYRYILSNDTLNEEVFFDVRVFNLNGEIVAGGCVFYTDNSFETKTTEFVSSYLLENEDPVELEYKVIFRFEDPDGNLLTDDILFSMKEIIKGPAKNEPVLLSAHGPNVLGAYRIASEEDALQLYNNIMKTFKDKGYTVVKDEVAAHTGSWYSDDPNVTMIYHVVLKAPEPTPTPTPEPTATPTPTPKPGIPIITKTGELISKYYYVGLAFIGIGGVIAIVVAIDRAKNRKKDDGESTES